MCNDKFYGSNIDVEELKMLLKGEAIEKVDVGIMLQRVHFSFQPQSFLLVGAVRKKEEGHKRPNISLTKHVCYT